MQGFFVNVLSNWHCTLQISYGLLQDVYTYFYPVNRKGHAINLKRQKSKSVLVENGKVTHLLCLD